jgi:hypothetical protein
MRVTLLDVILGSKGSPHFVVAPAILLGHCSACTNRGASNRTAHPGQELSHLLLTSPCIFNANPDALWMHGIVNINRRLHCYRFSIQHVWLETPVLNRFKSAQVVVFAQALYDL